MKLTKLFILLSLISLSSLGKEAPPSLEKDPALTAAFSLQNAFTTIADRSIPAVVVISNQRRYRNAGKMYPNIPTELRPFFGLPNHSPKQQKNQLVTVGRGSGFFINSNGYILTNYHVIQDATALEIRLSDGTTYNTIDHSQQFRIVGIDKDSDLAVLQIIDPKRQFPFLKFANSDQAKVGEWAIAIGAPFNLDYSMTVGVISQKGRNDVSKTKYQDYLQTDASINPGNSGGPLLNLRGEVLGINNCILTGGGQGSIGIGFAIAANFAQQTAKALIKDGKVFRSFLGIVVDELTPTLAAQLSTKFGLIIRQVMPHTPAEKAGLQPGDILQFINNEKIDSSKVFFSTMGKIPIGETLTLTIIRNGRQKNLQLKTELPQDVTPVKKIEAMGLTLVEDQDTLKITRIDPKSSFYNSAMAVGQKIIAINNYPMTSIETLRAVIQNAQGRTLIFLIEKENKERYLMKIRLL